MSLAELEEAVDKLSAVELAKLAAHIARCDKIAWDKEIEDDFSPGGKHKKHSRKSMLKSTQATSGPFRDFSCAAVLLEML